MLSLAKARKDYYLQKLGEVTPREDYYLRGGTATGSWHGNGAAEAGLQGRVSAEGLVRLFDGQHPATGEQLGRRLRKGGVAAWDLTFSADKSVSLLWALGGPTVRRQVLEAFEEATNEALVYLESVASSTRGATRIPILDDEGNPLLDEAGIARYRVETWPIQSAGYVAAWFTEFTSRADDPQLHSHVVVGNRVKGVDRAWRTLDGRLLYRHKLAAGYIHEAELRSRLTERLGVRWQPVENGMADVEGFTRDQIMTFSRRRKQIDAWREGHGIDDTPANNETIALVTRSLKQERPIADLMAEWQDRALQVGLTPAAIDAALNRTNQVTVPDQEPLFTDLVSPSGLTAETATFGRAEVIEGAAAALPEGGARTQIEALADALLRRSEVVAILPTPSLVGQPVDDGLIDGSDPAPMTPPPSGHDVFTGLVYERRYTTAELLAIEQAVICRAEAGVRAGRWTAPEALVVEALAHHPNLTGGQHRLVRRFATSGSAIDLAVGPAGTGKSAALAIVGELAIRTGTPILGTALAAKAATGFETATGIPSTTLTRLIGEATDRKCLPEGVVVVVDEAGMVGTRQLARLSELVEAASGKLILIGDYHQLPEIEAGGLFRALCNRLPAVELTDNVRQDHNWERDALAELRDGSVSRAIAMYHRRGRVIISASPEATIEQAVENWHRDVEATGDISEVLLIAYRNSTVDLLNRSARTAIESGGGLSGPTLETNGQPFREGERVVCLKNRPRLGVLNGDLATITNVDTDQKKVTVRLDRSNEARTLPIWYLDDGYLDYGYAITGHKAQGATTRLVHTVATEMVDREWIYVTMSRGQQANTLYLSDEGESLDDWCAHISRDRAGRMETLVAALARTAAKRAAVDLAGLAPLVDQSRGVGG